MRLRTRKTKKLDLKTSRPPNVGVGVFSLSLRNGDYMGKLIAEPNCLACENVLFCQGQYYLMLCARYSDGVESAPPRADRCRRVRFVHRHIFDSEQLRDCPMEKWRRPLEGEVAQAQKLDILLYGHCVRCRDAVFHQQKYYEERVPFHHQSVITPDHKIAFYFPSL
jgi:hypothetical protein